MRRQRGLGARLAAPFMLAFVRGLFWLARALGPDRSSDLGAWLTRTVGPLLPQHRVALANLRAVYPEKSEAETAAAQEATNKEQQELLKAALAKITVRRAAFTAACLAREGC